MKKLTSIFITGMLLFLVSCDLDENPTSDITAGSQLTTPEGFEDVVNASYEPLRFFFGDEQGCNMTEYGTDLTTNAGHGGFHDYNQYTAGLNSESGPIGAVWDNYYRGINTCNTAIDRASQVEFVNEQQEEEANIRVAEARYLRAFYYFTLVQYFGPIHLSLEETVGVETEANRTPEPEVYDAIVSDLELAVNTLPDEQEDYGRVTKPVAEMLLSQVLLTRGYQDFAQPDDFSRAATLAENVINNSGFELLDNFAAIFDNDNEENAEVIWSVQYGQDMLFNGPGNRSHLYYRPWYETFSEGLVRSLDPGYGRPWIRFKPTQFALENYRPLDQDGRYDQIFQDTWYYNDAGTLPTEEYPGIAVGDTAIYIDPDMTEEEVEELQDDTPYNLISWATIPTNMFPSLRKHDDFQRPTVNEERGNKDYIVYRLAEAYMFAAEAHFNMGNMQQAADHINVVRRRAAKPGMEDEMEISAGEVSLDFILDERGREFYGEQKRWLTLKRTGTLMDRVQQYNELGSPNIQDYHTMRPIPATQITRTDGGYEQNPGY